MGLGSGAWLRTQKKRASVGKNGLSFLALRVSIPRVGRRIFECSKRSRLRLAVKLLWLANLFDGKQKNVEKRRPYQELATPIRHDLQCDFLGRIWLAGNAVACGLPLNEIACRARNDLVNEDIY